ncbi:hypothetical protein LY56_03034 [Roseinatronobacter thiooxidans]|uniref:Uncharacterized protein n=1 Tax=Roseinatronobacter thiooxidans TaxID=121821 RepID=A0A2W7PPU7_9RHOB|nr:hypothetical protein [Roseinatronobacter thiooxidans]PZX38331.1 hypothetical protein LY56_03034 [Roseinatronobacter thiooxidans]
MNRAYRMASLLAQLRSERDFLALRVKGKHAVLSRRDSISLPEAALQPLEHPTSSHVPTPPALVPSPGFFLEHHATVAVVLLNCLGLPAATVSHIARTTQARLAAQGASGVYLVTCPDIHPLVAEGITVEVLPASLLLDASPWAAALNEFIGFLCEKYAPVDVVDMGTPSVATWRRPTAPPPYEKMDASS